MKIQETLRNFWAFLKRNDIVIGGISFLRIIVIVFWLWVGVGMVWLILFLISLLFTG